MIRDTAVQTFLNETEAALARVTGPGAEVAAAAICRWAEAGQAGQDGTARLPVCDWIAPALAAQSSPLAASFAALQHRLNWGRRKSADPANANFWNGHDNAMILGPGGLEERSDVWVGATVMAPGTLYPDHNHPPAEVYVPLSAGAWWNAQMDWTDPGLDGFIFNPPGILHAMRAGDKPFLALWVLPT